VGIAFVPTVLKHLRTTLSGLRATGAASLCRSGRFLDKAIAAPSPSGVDAA
jgi:hypothetical protein